MDEQKETLVPVTLFYSYAHEDKDLCDQLEKHLTPLQRQGLIATWHDRQIIPGTERPQAIDRYLKEAFIILLLVSPDFLASDDCYNQMQIALERQKAGTAQIIPIILRPVNLQGTPLERLECLPSNGSPVTEWTNQDIAFRDIAGGIRNAIEHMPSFSSTIHNPAKAHGFLAPLTSRRNVTDQRQRLLARIRSRWITTFLKHSLQGATLIALDLHEESNMVLNPWKSVVQEFEQPKHALPPGTRITQAYDYAEGELLLLGEPGSGKTTLLLELTWALLDRAEQDNTHPIPVVFNLSSWEDKQLPLADWIVEELNSKYQVPCKLGQDWVDAELVLLLLDGLDEVGSSTRMTSTRMKCIETINQYRQEHGMVSLVVCCRSVDYLGQPQHLQLRRAVTIQPLTIQQIEEYLLSVGRQSDALLTALHKDSALGELVKTPLMLSILALSYQEIPIEVFVIEELGSLSKQWRQVFANYISYVLQRRKFEKRYTPAQTINTLGWLADQMLIHNQLEFSIEQIQKDWLPQKWMRSMYNTTLVLVSSLIGGLIFGLISGLVLELMRGFILEALIASALGLVFGFFFGISCAFHLSMLDAILDRRLYFRRTILRLLLSSTGVMPWNYNEFLDHAVEHILLRKVGNKYTFIHRLFLIHFATREMSLDTYGRSNHSNFSAT